MLTDEQIAIRATGIGASEIASIAGINPWATPIDTWLTKPSPTRAAIIPEESDEIGPGAVGSYLEPSMAALYTAKTGHALHRPQATIRHPEHSWVLASPDAILVDQPERLVEFKVVGGMVSDWDDGVPAYVRCQCLWQCLVTGANLVDVAVLMGTDFRILPIERDDEIIASLFEIGREFWFDHVLTDTPPPPAETEDRKEYMQKRFQKYRDELRVLETDEAVKAVTELVAHYIDAKAAAVRAETIKKAAEATLMEIIGDKAGVECPLGRVTWKRPEFGGISYKAIAEELAPHGLIPPDVYARHTSTPSRRFHFAPPPKLTSKRNGGR